MWYSNKEIILQQYLIHTKNLSYSGARSTHVKAKEEEEEEEEEEEDFFLTFQKEHFISFL